MMKRKSIAVFSLLFCTAGLAHAQTGTNTPLEFPSQFECYSQTGLCQPIANQAGQQIPIELVNQSQPKGTNTLYRISAVNARNLFRPQGDVIQYTITYVYEGEGILTGVTKTLYTGYEDLTDTLPKATENWRASQNNTMVCNLPSEPLNGNIVMKNLAGLCPIPA